jgi:PAS domain S-box-containing protein
MSENYLTGSVSDNPSGPATKKQARYMDWNEVADSEHIVQFYDSDEFFVNSLHSYVASGLKAGQACVVVLTAEHRKRLEELLLAGGLDPKAAARSGQYISPDATETLAKLTASGTLDAELLASMAADMLEQAEKGGRRVRLTGEMVALLWRQGRYDEAMRLESLWLDIAKNRPFSILCGYPMTSFAEMGSHESSFVRVCEGHSRIIPAESYSGWVKSNDRLQAIVGLQQKAHLLEAEIELRQSDEKLVAHLAAIVESSDDAIISKSLEGEILTWNKGAERIFGYTAEEIIGRSVYLLIPPDRVDEEPRILEQLKHGERIDHYQTVRLTKAGRRIDVSLTVSPIKDKSGRIVGASKIARDITESKLAEERLREQTEIIETINRTGQILSADLKLHSVVQTVIDATTLLTGAQYGSFFYKITDETESGTILAAHSGPKRQVLENLELPKTSDICGKSVRSNGIIRIDDAKTDPRYSKTSPYCGIPADELPVISYLAAPVISRSGEVLGGLFFGHQREAEFTERDERIVEGLAAQAAIAIDNALLYELSQREKTKAEMASRTKDEFLATVSHELRTPLSAILGWAHLLMRTGLNDTVRIQAIDCIERSAKLQSQLIEDILDVSRIITGNLRLNHAPVDMAEIVNAAVESVQLTAESKGVQLQVFIDPVTRLVNGDVVRLQQVVWNLLTNAIKFTPTGGQVQLILERSEPDVRIVVSDTGQGISADFLPYVFDRFRQADGSSTRRHGGLGLGLTLVRHLVELHGGTVEASSQGEGRGSTFVVTIPLMERSLRRSAATSDAQPTEVPVSDPLGSLDGIQVLLVDDDRDTLSMLAVMLIGCAANVQTASSVAEAMQILQTCEPDVVVSDLGMPDEDGFALISKMHELRLNNDRHIPTIALTAYTRPTDRTSALLAGFDMFVPKPVEPRELVSMIAELAGLRPPQDRQS